MRPNDSGIRIGLTYQESPTTIDTLTVASETIPPGIPTPIDIDDPTTVIVSAEWQREALTVLGEIGQSDEDLDFGNGFVIPMRTEGWYLSADYEFTDWFSAALTYSEYYPNRNDKNGQVPVSEGGYDFEAWQKEWIISTRFNIRNSVYLKLEHRFIDGTGNILDQYNEDELEQHWSMTAAKVTYIF